MVFSFPLSCWFWGVVMSSGLSGNQRHDTDLADNNFLRKGNKDFGVYIPKKIKRVELEPVSLEKVSPVENIKICNIGFSVAFRACIQSRWCSPAVESDTKT